MTKTRMNEATRRRFRRIVNKLGWRKALMPRMYDCPHEYVIHEFDVYTEGAPWSCPELTFDFLRDMIEKYGEAKPWRSRRDVVMFVGSYAYWCADEVINRTYRAGYQNGGHPTQKVLAILRRRFWPTTADRREYKRITNSRARWVQPRRRR